MPKKKIIKKDIHDRFYTKDDIAKSCIDVLMKYVSSDDLFVEPSAGGGAFFRQLPDNKIGIDLFPTCDDVIQHDWLTYIVPENCVIVGNPPFGERNKLTNNFIKHSLLSSKVVAFILPSVYRKETMQKVFPDEWVLVDDITLPESSFLLDGNDYHVPCVFQVWVKNSTLENLRESYKEKVTVPDFTFTTKNDATHFIFGAAPQKVVDKKDVLDNNRGYWIVVESDNVIGKIKSIDWRKHGLSSVNGGVSWFSKQQIINIFHEENYVNRCK